MLKTVHNTSNKFNFFKFFLALLPFAMWKTGCSNAPSQHEEAAQQVFSDALGRKVTVTGEPKRVMALAPSMTEILFFVGDTSQIVGVTQNCDFPAAARTKPVVNNYPMDYEALLGLKPDLVFTVEGITPLADARRIEELGIPVYYQQYQTVEDILKGIETVGTIIGRTAQAKHLTDSLRIIKTTIQQETASLSKPSVLAITWQDPIYAYGKNTVFTDKLAIAGAANAIDTVFDVPYPPLTREYILKINPDIIIGGSFEKMDSTFFKQYPELKKVNAYRNRRVYAVTDDLMARPGPRVMESIVELKKIIHSVPAS